MKWQHRCEIGGKGGNDSIGVKQGEKGEMKGKRKIHDSFIYSQRTDSFPQPFCQ